ncbi:MAG: hypothetical protein BWX84_01316 [Verrucomicrobia bacterium ADurb.Bin118]|nr:MAG: hypothetical protein BWX84_01316 [Verrucomicrobia bacterium ADurb.Bin118]
MGADVHQICAVGEGVLRDDVHVAPVIERILGFAARRGEAFAENGVGGAEPAGIRAAVEDRVAGHLRVDEFDLFRILPQLGAQFRIITERAVGRLERRREHVVPEPIAEQVPVLLVLEPVLHERITGHDGEHGQGDHQGRPLTIHRHPHHEDHGHPQQQQAGKDRQPVLMGRKGVPDALPQHPQRIAFPLAAEHGFRGQGEGEEGQRESHRAAEQAPEAETGVLGGHVGGDQCQAVSHQQRHAHVGRGEKDAQ